ncbi:hypothetical protein MKW11_08315 [Gluconobacter frateurii]|nr:serine dehydratase beta chain [Gluconobacter frateurii]UMM07238.1 hypothetical protein MKW11_08315 [Gluconobacter frateurii]
MISLFDLFRIGLGPSSSHTVGPMRAGLSFVQNMHSDSPIGRIQVTLYGSLAWTPRECDGLRGFKAGFPITSAALRTPRHQDDPFQSGAKCKETSLSNLALSFPYG